MAHQFFANTLSLKNALDLGGINADEKVVLGRIGRDFGLWVINSEDDPKEIKMGKRTPRLVSKMLNGKNWGIEDIEPSELVFCNSRNFPNGSSYVTLDTLREMPTSGYLEVCDGLLLAGGCKQAKDGDPGFVSYIFIPGNFGEIQKIIFPKTLGGGTDLGVHFYNRDEKLTGEMKIETFSGTVKVHGAVATNRMLDFGILKPESGDSNIQVEIVDGHRTRFRYELRQNGWVTTVWYNCDNGLKAENQNEFSLKVFMTFEEFKTKFSSVLKSAWASENHYHILMPEGGSRCQMEGDGVCIYAPKKYPNDLNEEDLKLEFDIWGKNLKH